MTSQTLTPSSVGMGRNVYLSEKHFWTMIGVAACLHLVVVLAVSYWRSDEVVEIPVRALSLKLGGGESWQPATPPPAPAPVRQPLPKQQAAPLPPPPAPKPVAKRDTARMKPTKPAAPAKPKPSDSGPKRIKIEEALKPKPGIPSQTNLPRISKLSEGRAVAAPADPVQAAPLTTPAIAKEPTQYVRPRAVASAPEGENISAAEMKARYEQQISQWLAKHRHYPAAARMLGQHGKPVLRIRIDRQGNLKFTAIERSSGYRLIDDAAMDMARRANPVPAPPLNYPGEKLLEFLIPVSFDLQ